MHLQAEFSWSGTGVVALSYSMERVLWLTAASSVTFSPRQEQAPDLALGEK